MSKAKNIDIKDNTMAAMIKYCDLIANEVLIKVMVVTTIKT